MGPGQAAQDSRCLREKALAAAQRSAAPTAQALIAAEERTATAVFSVSPLPPRKTAAQSTGAIRQHGLDHADTRRRREQAPPVGLVVYLWHPLSFSTTSRGTGFVPALCHTLPRFAVPQPHQAG